jgi:ATP-dependent RNA helicase DBP3
MAGTTGNTLAFLLGAFASIIKSLNLWERLDTLAGNESNTAGDPISPDRKFEDDEDQEAVDPKIEHLRRLAILDRPTATPLVVILSPTRELATQTFTVTQQICKNLGFLRAISLMGGPSVENQIELLQTNIVDLIVCTSGRLSKLLKADGLHLDHVKYFVLDEADRMIDIGFEDDLRLILSHMQLENRKSSTDKPQIVMFSATWPESTKAIVENLLGSKDIPLVQIGGIDLAAAKNVKQIVEIIDKRNAKREKRLLELLKEYGSDPKSLIIIFVLYKREADDVSSYLQRHGHPCIVLHGDKAQGERKIAMAAFRTGQSRILVATDVAARGLDVPNVTHVINFSLGLSVENYIHRIGRSGRAGAKGVAHTFLIDTDYVHAPALIDVLRKSGASIPAELFEWEHRAERRDSRHKDERGLHGDALFAHRRSKQVDEEEEIERKIFGDSDDEESGVRTIVGRGKTSNRANAKSRNDPKNRRRRH